MSNRSDGPDPDLALRVDESPASGDLDRLRAGLTEHARPFVAAPGFRPLAVFARDRAGDLVGGAYGHLNWNWLHVSLLWLDERLRGRGVGARLLLALEGAARERGCRRVHLDTFSYQAREFYEQLGYEVFARLDDYPPGHSRFFLRKELDS